MKIEAKGIGRKFGKHWLFRNLDLSLEQGMSYAITGNNGSGKSTLMKALAGILPLSEGKINYTDRSTGKAVDTDNIYRFISYAGPYTELVEEFTLEEMLSFYSSFKPISISSQSFVNLLGFEAFTKKQIGLFSSGMKQKLKLGLALHDISPITFLDEPTSNFDTSNIAWYGEQVRQSHKNKLLIIASNQDYEFDFCDRVIYIGQ